MFFFAISYHNFSSVSVGQKIFFLFEGKVVSGIVIFNLFLCFDTLVFVGAREGWACSRFGAFGGRLFDCLLSSI